MKVASESKMDARAISPHYAVRSAQCKPPIKFKLPCKGLKIELDTKKIVPRKVTPEIKQSFSTYGMNLCSTEKTEMTLMPLVDVPAQTLVAPLSRHAVAFNSCHAAFSINPKCLTTSQLMNGFPLCVLRSALCTENATNCLAFQKKEKIFSFSSKRMTFDLTASCLLLDACSLQHPRRPPGLPLTPRRP